MTDASVLHHNPQLNADGELAHLLSTDGLPRGILTQILVVLLIGSMVFGTLLTALPLLY